MQHSRHFDLVRSHGNLPSPKRDGSGGCSNFVMGRFIRGRILVRTIDFGFVLEMREQSCGVIRHATPLDTRLARNITNTKAR
jgi:hypothetical protein